jgi:hypothetical protein
MFYNRKIAVSFLATLVLLLSSCANLESPFSNRQPEPERNILTGEVGSNGKVIAIKFDDTTYAHPQQGVEAADVVFVTQVEAGLTRLMGIYSSTYPEILGPVRSARISDIDILAQFGRVGFVYSGAQSKLRPVLAQSELVNLSAERNPPTIYFNDPTRNAPYAVMVRLPLLLDKAEEVAQVKSVGWEHGEISQFALPVTGAKVSWPNASYELIWNPESEKFNLNFDGRPNLAQSGEQLGSNMMIVQLVEIYPSEYGDKFGGVTPKSDVVGTGDAFLFRDGSVTKVRWIRNSAAEPTNWLLENGEVARFSTGQVWIFLTDKAPEISFSAPAPAP